MESIKITQDESVIIKKINIKKNECLKKEYFKYLMIFAFFFLLCLIINVYRNNTPKFNINKIDKNNYDLNFKYHLYEREMITEKMKKYGGWQLRSNEPYFINGIIRKFKPKKCLEVGVARGGSSIIILNALKDINDSFLISLDLNTFRKRLKIGENVKKYFPELTNNNKWQQYTRRTTS